jgi:hypothetical protein
MPELRRKIVAPDLQKRAADRVKPAEEKSMKILSKFLLLAVLATQFSCGTMRQIELEQNRRLWRDSRIANYKMTVDLRKTGHAAPSGKFIMTVRGGAPESVASVNKPDVDVSGGVIKFGNYDTIDDIFQYIERADRETSSWDTRVVEYDSKLGYPKKVSLDEARVFDEELSFQVLEFEILE